MEFFLLLFPTCNAHARDAKWILVVDLAVSEARMMSRCLARV